MVAVPQRLAQTLYSILPNACRGKERRVKGCAKKVEVKRAIAKNAKSRHKKLKTVSRVLVCLKVQLIVFLDPL